MSSLRRWDNQCNGSVTLDYINNKCKGKNKELICSPYTSQCVCKPN